MARLAFRAAVGVLWAALATACLGGQTGQPTSGNCPTTKLSSQDAWSDTTVQAAAASFAGTYASGLEWQVEPRSKPSHTPVDLQDNAQLTITYQGASASLACVDPLKVPVSVTLTTTDSGIAEIGQGTLEILRSSQGLEGSLRYEGSRVRITAQLSERATEAAPAVDIDALDSALPGASATFTEGT